MMVSVILALMIVFDFSYPVARFSFYLGYLYNQESYYIANSVLEGVQSCCLNLGLWLFAIKMWALAKQLENIQM